MSLHSQIAEIVHEGCSFDLPCDGCSEDADRILALLTGDPVGWLVTIECPGGQYIEYWSAIREDRARAQYAEAVEMGDTATIEALYTTPPQVSAEYVDSRLKQIDALKATRTHDKLKIDGLEKSVSAYREALEEIAALANWLGATVSSVEAPGDTNEYRPWEAEGITECDYFKRRYFEARMEAGDIEDAAPGDTEALRAALEGIVRRANTFMSYSVNDAARDARRALASHTGESDG